MSEPEAIRVETPAGSFLYREVPDPSPAAWLRWRRGVEILRELATKAEERAAPVGGPPGEEQRTESLAEP